VGEVGGRTGRTVERLDVGYELNQITRHEACGQTEVAEDLYQQPARVAPGSAGTRQRLVGRLHARFEPDQIPDLLRQPPIQIDEKVDGLLRSALDMPQSVAERGSNRRGIEKRRQLLGEPRLVSEGGMLH